MENQLYFYPETYGAAGDGKTNDCTAIQKALDAAFKNGGGTVVLASGKTYYTDFFAASQKCGTALNERVAPESHGGHKRLYSPV